MKGDSSTIIRSRSAGWEASILSEWDHKGRSLGLDAVRALAIGMVLLAHLGTATTWWLGLPPPPSAVAVAGSLGVELFFALSGFLIGSLLLELIERDPSLGGLGRFMARRWLRTLPLYGFCLAVQALLWRPAGDVSHHLWQYATLTQNLLWPMPPDNWFGVSWSLTVEEWFYLLFSAMLIGGVALTGRRKTCLWGVVALFIVIPTLLRWQVPDSAEFTNHIARVALRRLDAITYGVVVAALHRGPLAKQSFLLLAIGLAILGEQLFQIIPLTALSAHAIRTFGPNIIPLGFALCLPAMLHFPRLPVFIERSVQWLSRESYALYLVNSFVIEVVAIESARFNLPGPTRLAAAVVGVFGISHALHRWLEKPILVRRPKQYPGPTQAPSALTSRRRYST